MPVTMNNITQPQPDSELVWPENFLKGVALSVFQNSGDGKSNWTDYIKAKNYLGQRQNAAAFEKAADFWEMYETDIKTAKELGATSFRFSFEWARFEPEGPGTLDEATCERYSQILDCCAAHGLEPMATLHHFVHPSWFETLGGFTEEKNNHHFVSYSTAVFKRFGPRIKLWSTFNEPTCFAFVGYIVGLWAPGQVMKVAKAGVVLCNLLKAHCSTYRAIKQMAGGKQACVGIVHQHIVFTPRHNLPHVRALCKWMTFWFATHTMLTFFTTGVFEWDTPFRRGGPKAIYTDPGVAAGEVVNDWWGINYYSRPCVHWNFSMGPSKDNEPVSDIHFRLYPQGLYDSIKDASVLKVPIYITEMGLADKEDKYRGWYIKAAYSMLLKSINDGYDVRGVYWWTLMDNIEWHDGFKIKFGLYQWDPAYADKYKDSHNRPPGGLRLREGAKQLPIVHSAWPDAFPDLKRYAAQQDNVAAEALAQEQQQLTAKSVTGGSGGRTDQTVRADRVASSAISTTQVHVHADSGNLSVQGQPPHLETQDLENVPLVAALPDPAPTATTVPGWNRAV